MLDLREFAGQLSTAWELTILSSAMCIMGATIIFIDVVVRVINPRSNFSIKSSGNFLICGFAISSGSLLTTSLYRLLPKAYSYFSKAIKKQRNLDPALDPLFGMGPNTAVMLSLLAGTLLCLGLNQAIHYFTSESIVHCAHGEDSDSEHSHSHSELSHNHSHSLSGVDEEEDIKHTHHHAHSHDQSHFHDEEMDIESPGPTSSTRTIVTETTPLTTDNEPTTYVVATTEEHLLGPKAQKKSIMNIIDKITHPGAPCQGIFDKDCDGLPCVSEQLTYRVSNDINNLEFYRDVSLRRTKSSLIAYTTENPEHLHHSDPTSALPGGFETPAKPYIVSSVIATQPSNIRLTTEPNLDRHTRHKDDHHHNITTPVSRLLSIGLQTCLALALHKFPEGFIQYATAEADPQLGLSIFLSLGIHNVIEGFSMIFPLYLALNSRLQAFAITFVLGGLSQPIGALVASWFLHGRKLGKDESLDTLGSLMGITSGFLTVISLQLFASAISFGGSTNKVIRWFLCGTFIILLSSTFTDFKH